VISNVYITTAHLILIHWMNNRQLYYNTKDVPLQQCSSQWVSVEFWINRT